MHWVIIVLWTLFVQFILFIHWYIIFYFKEYHYCIILCKYCYIQWYYIIIIIKDCNFIRWLNIVSFLSIGIGFNLYMVILYIILSFDLIYVYYQSILSSIIELFIQLLHIFINCIAIGFNHCQCAYWCITYYIVLQQYWIWCVAFDWYLSIGIAIV